MCTYFNYPLDSFTRAKLGSESGRVGYCANATVSGSVSYNRVDSNKPPISSDLVLRRHHHRAERKSISEVLANMELIFANVKTKFVATVCSTMHFPIYMLGKLFVNHHAKNNMFQFDSKLQRYKIWAVLNCICFTHVRDQYK